MQGGRGKGKGRGGASAPASPEAPEGSYEDVEDDQGDEGAEEVPAGACARSGSRARAGGVRRRGGGSGGGRARSGGRAAAKASPSGCQEEQEVSEGPSLGTQPPQGRRSARQALMIARAWQLQVSAQGGLLFPRSIPTKMDLPFARKRGTTAVYGEEIIDIPSKHPKVGKGVRGRKRGGAAAAATSVGVAGAKAAGAGAGASGSGGRSARTEAAQRVVRRALKVVSSSGRRVALKRRG